MIPPYQKLLSPEEHEACIKQGMILTAVSAAQIGPEMKKVAQMTVGNTLASVGTVGDYSTRMLMTLSVVTGVPIGILAHVVGKKLGERRAEERGMEDEAKYYHNAAKGLETEMARQGVKSAAGALIAVKQAQSSDPMAAPIPPAKPAPITPAVPAVPAQAKPFAWAGSNGAVEQKYTDKLNYAAKPSLNKNIAGAVTPADMQTYKQNNTGKFPVTAGQDPDEPYVQRYTMVDPTEKMGAAGALHILKMANGPCAIPLIPKGLDRAAKDMDPSVHIGNEGDQGRQSISEVTNRDTNTPPGLLPDAAKVGRGVS